MIALINEILGPWTWIALAFLILGIEILAPSTLLLWPGLAALVVGAITLILGTESAVWPWQAQIISFLVLTLLIAYFGKQYVKDNNIEESEVPDLNERGDQMIGETAILKEPITNGYGRAKIGDTTWRVKGDDAKAGSRIRVVATDGGTLIVEAD